MLTSSGSGKCHGRAIVRKLSASYPVEYEGNVPSSASAGRSPPDAGAHRLCRTAYRCRADSWWPMGLAPPAAGGAPWRRRAAVDAAMHGGPDDLPAVPGPRQGGVRAVLLGRDLPAAGAAGAGDRHGSDTWRMPAGGVRLQSFIMAGCSGAWRQSRRLLRIEGRSGRLAVGRHRRPARPHCVHLAPAPRDRARARR